MGPGPCLPHGAATHGAFWLPPQPVPTLVPCDAVVPPPSLCVPNAHRFGAQGWVHMRGRVVFQCVCPAMPAASVSPCVRARSRLVCVLARQELFCPMPIVHFKPAENKKKAGKAVYVCPLYMYPVRTGTRERPSFMIPVELKSGAQEPEFWVKRGTALLLALST